MKIEEKLKARFFVGFFVAMAGICLISSNGKELELNPIRDVLAVVAALVIVLKEEITWVSAIGTILTLIGMFLSESRLKIKKRGKENKCRE